MKTAKEYRAEASAKMTGNYLMAFILGLVYAACTAILACIGGVGQLILGGVFSIGFFGCFLNVIRGGKIELADLFKVFKNGGLTSAIVMNVLRTIFVALWSLLFIIPGFIASLSYSMADFILADNPTMDGQEALKASKKLMMGKKWKLFCVLFSYIGWILLSELTCGILFIWVLPRMYACEAAFYESIKDELNA